MSWKLAPYLAYHPPVKLTILVSILCALAGCGSNTGGSIPAVDADPLAPDAPPGAPDARPGAPDARPGVPDAPPATIDAGAPDAAPVPEIASCYLSCASPSDCAIGTSTLYDADNWSCTSGSCHYLGCNSTAECQSAYASTAYVCQVGTQTGGMRSCLETCSTPADCAVGTSSIDDASHWSCSSGTCSYLGCQTASECQTAHANQAYTCAELPGGGSMRECQHTCATSADCAPGGTGIFGTDDWSCLAGLCQWDGCMSDAECQSTYMSTAYVCRKP